ncbi:MAG: hypothetical protein HPY76_11615 [Anaerolineae bacterium]|nr:hypothetical protein [Anaerolineae bacterium]
MKGKNWIWITLVVATLLAACQPAATPGNLATTATPAVTTAQPTTGAVTGSEAAICVSEDIPIPPPGEDDYILGDEGAGITIIEYSDFQ